MERKVVFNEARFDAKFIKGTDDECWLWTAGKSKHGYGAFGVSINGKRSGSNANRVALYRKLNYDDEFWFSKLDAGHTCANSLCVNPSHLTPQTRKENIDERDNRLGNEYHVRGSVHKSSKLSESQVLAIRSIKGKTQKDLAKDFGVDPSLISQIILRKIWNHI
jgi:hypothetical protein